MTETFPAPFGRYQLVERLAVGGMAELFRARMVGAHGFQKPVVIKKILPHLAADVAFVDMFIDEAKITARLDHPKIAQVLELGTIDEQLYIAMEYVDGVDVLAVLRACAQRKQSVPPPIAVHLCHEVLDALDYAHQARDEEGKPLGIVHRDISPSNVMVSRRGDVKLADFGIAHALDRQQKTRTGMLKGKYGYMSPEQVVGGAIDGRSDLFSVGILLAEMLMGRRLFLAPNELDVLLMVRDVKLERLERFGGDIEPRLLGILRQALHRQPADRFASAAAFRDELADWQFAKRQRVTPVDLSAYVERLGIPTRQSPIPTPVGGIPVPPQVVPRDPRLTPAPAPVPSVVAPAPEPAPRFPVSPTPVTAPPPPAYVPITVPPVDNSKPTETDFGDLQIDVSLELLAGDALPGQAWARESTPEPEPAPSQRLGKFGEPVDAQGDLSTTPPIRVLYQHAIEKATGLLVVDLGGKNNAGMVKEIYLVQGTPEYVASNLAHELLGEYLVAQRVVSEGELSMALAMMPHFGGKLGDTLVGLSLMKPLDVFRHLTRQVREKLVDVCTWQKGTWRWYAGKKNPREAFPLGLDAFEVLGAGARAMGMEPLQTWAAEHQTHSPVALKNHHVVPEAFRMGSYPRDLYNKLDGHVSLGRLLGRYTLLEERLVFLRTLYLLVHTELARLG